MARQKLDFHYAHIETGSKFFSLHCFWSLCHDIILSFKKQKNEVREMRKERKTFIHLCTYSMFHVKNSTPSLYLHRTQNRDNEKNTCLKLPLFFMPQVTQILWYYLGFFNRSCTDTYHTASHRRNPRNRCRHRTATRQRCTRWYYDRRSDWLVRRRSEHSRPRPRTLRNPPRRRSASPLRYRCRISRRQVMLIYSEKMHTPQCIREHRL